MRPKPTAIYDDVIRLAHTYFGPEAAKHVGKTIKVHLQKSPEQMTKDELISLIDWIKNAASFIAEDKNAADQYISDLIAITQSDQRYEAD